MVKSYIGCSLTHDGMGSRFQRILTAMVLSFYLEKDGIEYLHLPMAYEGFGLNFKQGDRIRQKGYSMSHSTEYIKNAQRWDDEINFKGTTIHDINPDDFTIVMGTQLEVFKHIMDDIRLEQTNGKIYLFDSLHRLVWGHVIDSDLFNTYRNRLNSCFDLKSEPTNKILVHIRRKDIINHSSRYLPDSYYKKILQHFIPEEVLITTQREGFNECNFQQYDVVFDDQISEIDIMKKMVNSKILVISASSFSYSAGILNEGIIYSPPNINKLDKLKHWL